LINLNLLIIFFKIIDTYLRNFQLTVGSAVLFSINIQKIKVIASIVGGFLQLESTLVIVAIVEKMLCVASASVLLGARNFGSLEI
jgi:hypothetical protein